MLETVSDGDRRAQVGVGTLVLFVAMVLIAALTASVLMGTAGVLQSQAEATGQESIAQVSNNLNVYTTVGTVDADGNVDSLEMTVSLGPGSDPIDLENIVIEYLGPDSQAYITDVPVEIDSRGGTVLETGNDRGRITIDLDEEVQPLDEGNMVLITIHTNDGAKTTEELSVPSVLTDEGSIRL